jgi:DNA-binding transcriptional MerR regulator
VDLRPPTSREFSFVHPSFTPPRQVKIGVAAAFAGTTPRAVRHYPQHGLLSEPTRGIDGHRYYGYEDLIQLLWIRKIADAGMALEKIREAFAVSDDPAREAGAYDTDGIKRLLGRLAEDLAEQHADLRRKQAAVHRMRTDGSRMGLLSDLVVERLRDLPAGSIRQADLDSLLITKRFFGPIGAAVQATRFIALATQPALRERSDQLDSAEEALDDGVDVNDPAKRKTQRGRRGVLVDVEP